MLLGLQERVLIGGFIFGELAHRTKDPPTLARALPSSRRGHIDMCPRVSALWGDKSVFWFATWTWPEFRSENSFGILGFRRSDDLGICCAFLFRNLSNHVDLFFLKREHAYGRQVGFLIHHLDVSRISIRKQFRNPWLQAQR